jgi:hypothetical protein
MGCLVLTDLHLLHLFEAQRQHVAARVDYPADYSIRIIFSSFMYIVLQLVGTRVFFLSPCLLPRKSPSCLAQRCASGPAHG